MSNGAISNINTTRENLTKIGILLVSKYLIKYLNQEKCYDIIRFARIASSNLQTEDSPKWLGIDDKFRAEFWTPKSSYQKLEYMINVFDLQSKKDYLQYEAFSILSELLTTNGLSVFSCAAGRLCGLNYIYYNCSDKKEYGNKIKPWDFKEEVNDVVRRGLMPNISIFYQLLN